MILFLLLYLLAFSETIVVILALQHTRKSSNFFLISFTFGSAFSENSLTLSPNPSVKFLFFVIIVFISKWKLWIGKRFVLWMLLFKILGSCFRTPIYSFISLKILLMVLILFLCSLHSLYSIKLPFSIFLFWCPFSLWRFFSYLWCSLDVWSSLRLRV